MKSLLLGIVVIIIVGIGGLVYRNALEYPSQPVACPLDALVCPDGTKVARTGSACEFPVCPPPNVTVASIGLSFALPSGLTTTDLPDESAVAAYSLSTPATASSSEATPPPEIHIVVRRYAIHASSTALATIRQTAIGGASGAPINPTSFSSTVIGNHRFTVVTIERFEGIIDTAYYLARNNDVLRFDAIDRNADWTNPSLDVSKLPAHTALAKLLTTLQGQ